MVANAADKSDQGSAKAMLTSLKKPEPVKKRIHSCGTESSLVRLKRTWQVQAA